MENLILKQGGYRNLKSFQLAQLVYDITVRFCDKFISPYSRTKDQMVQAARSGVQNIAEGSQASATSKNLFKILESPRFEFFSPRKQHKNLVNINQYNPGFCAASWVENNFKYGHSKILNRF